MDASAAPPQKQHRPSRNKVKSKSNGKTSLKQAVAKPGAFARRVRLSADRAEKRALNPALPTDRSGGDASPRIVAVVGPSGAGKSTIIRNLVKHYTKRNVPTITGPITIVTGRRKRMTFLEIGPDLSSMIDAAKIADLVLLVIDASFGFEMETFEFLNVAAAHGMPKIMAVLTHLDKLRDGKQVRRAKKSLKDRIWAELYDGAKVFYLSGITTTDDYLSREILNLARFISVTKHARVKWRADHPYILADRVEDITPKSLPANANRSLATYGYVRGTPLRTTTGEWRLHLPGVGDLVAKNVEVLSDPCPTPELHTADDLATAAGSKDQTKRKRKVSEKDRVIYAPMAPEVDGISYDRDAVYINLAPENIRFSDKRGLVADSKEADIERNILDGEESSEGEGEKMVKDMQKAHKSTVDESLKRSTIQLVSGGKRLVSERFSNDDRSKRERVSDSRKYPELGEAQPSYEDDLEGEGDVKQIDDTSYVKQGIQSAVGDAEEPVLLDEQSSEDDHSLESSIADSDEETGNDNNSSDDLANAEERAAQIWKNRTLDNARERLRQSVSPSKALLKYIYGITPQGISMETNPGNSLPSLDPHHNSGEDSEEDSFFTPKRSRTSVDSLGSNMFSTAILDDLTRLVPQSSKDWVSLESRCKSLRKLRFGTGQSKPNDEEDELVSLNDDSVDGDFEDLETGKVHKSRPLVDDSKRAEKEDDFESPDSDIEDIRKRKIEKKQEFDAAWDRRDNTSYRPEERKARPEAEDHNELHGGRKGRRDAVENLPDPRIAERDRLEKAKRSAFGGLHDDEKRLLEGILPGRYVRLELQDVPIEFVKFFNPQYPVILGGLKSTDDEGNMFLRAKIRRHRFKRGVLKSHDPVIFSVGWRRFQSMPVYDTEDQGDRKRFLKYTPEYLHCNATFWGPSVAPGTGVIMCQSLGRDRTSFRIAGSGHVTEVDTSFEVVKKLKLVGEPFKVHKNTAFIKGMFNSELEVSKYIGASIRTVSGIRGSIKKAISEAAQRGALDRDIARSPAGSFRGGFEDKVLLSDIVYLRAWVPVKPAKFYSTAATLLDKERTGNGAWRMRTVREIREQKQLPIPLQKDSLYNPVERVAPQFAPLKISRKLEGSLPYASKPKNFAAKRIEKTNVPERKAAIVAERAVVLEAKERQEQKLLQTVYTIRNERSKRRKEANLRRMERRKREWELDEEKRMKITSERRKRKFATEGARETRITKRSRGEQGSLKR